MLEADGKHSWLYFEPWATWPVWARYARAFDRAMLVMVGEGDRSDAHEEIVIYNIGLVSGE